MNNVTGTFRVYGGGRDAALRFAFFEKATSTKLLHQYWLHYQFFCMYRCEFPRGSHIVSNIVWEKVGDSRYGYNRFTTFKTFSSI